MHFNRQRREIAKAIQGGILLGPPQTSPNAVRVRGTFTGRVYPCCWSDCTNDGDARVSVDVPHDAPRFPGEQLTYIFCSDQHRDHWIKATLHNIIGK